jgi:hypothetical protein
VFEKKVLGKIFVPEKDEASGQFRTSHEELRDLYRSPSIVTGLRTGRYSGVDV